MTRAESALSLRGALALTVTAFGLNWAWEAAQCRPFFVHPLPCPGSLAMIAPAIGDVFMTWIAYGLIAVISRDWDWVVHPWRRRQWATMVALAIVMSVGVERWALAAGRWSYTAANPLVPGVGVSAIPVLQLLVLFPLTFAAAAARDGAGSRTPGRTPGRRVP